MNKPKPNPEPPVETFDYGWIEWLPPEILDEWDLYIHMNARAIAMYSLEQEEEYVNKAVKRRRDRSWRVQRRNHGKG